MTFAIKNDTRPDSPHRDILDRISSGHRNAVTTQDLTTLLNTDRRHVRSMVESARIDGNIIAGTNDGLFIPETEEELREYVLRSYSHIKGSVKSLNPAYKKIYGKNIPFGGGQNE